MSALIVTRTLAALAAVFAFQAVAQAQPTVSINGSAYRAGADFATESLQDPWDFSNVEDITPNPDEVRGWSTTPANRWMSEGTGPTFINTTTGRFTGQAAGDDQVMILARPDAIGLNPGRTGHNFPIDTSRYRKLAVKMRVIGAPAGQQLVAYWYHDAYAAANYLNRAGGIVLPDNIPAGTSERLYVFDLSQAGSGGSQLVPACGGGGECTGVPAGWGNEAWVRGFRLDPVSSFASQGVEIDWVRLTTANNHPAAVSMPVSVGSCSSFSHLIVTDATGFSQAIHDTTGNNSQRTFYYGILPPGAYNVRAVCGNGTSAPASFRIDAPPSVTVIDPDETGAAHTDYAALHRGGDRWDFEQLSDIAASTNVSLTAGACANGGCGVVPSERPGAAPGSRMLRASSAGSSPSQLGDPTLEFLNGAIPPLSGARHQFLTFSLRLHRPFDLATGSMVRILWGSASSGDGRTITQTQDMRVWPGFKTYTLDLASLTRENGGLEYECLPNCLTTPWASRSLRFLRIDPHEFGDAPTGFDIDDVSLTAPDEVALGQQFAVRYRFTDADSAGSTYVARVYLETYPQRTGRTLLDTINNVSPNSVLTYAFNPQARGVSPGRYSLFVHVTETNGALQHGSGSYATGPLVVYSSSSSAPQVTMSIPSQAGMVPFPFTINGCAFDAGTDTGGINMDEVAAYAIAGSGVAGVAPGTVKALGFGNGTGTLQYGPLTGTNVTCPSVSNPGSPYRNAGFRLSDVGLQAGPWTIRTYARSTLTGALTAAADVPVNVTQLTLPPQNFQASASGNTVTVSFQAPNGGPPVAGYAVDGSYNPDFNPGAFTVIVPAPGTYSGQLGNGTFYLRVRSLGPGGAPGMASETRVVTLGPVQPDPPGAPHLNLVSVANPVALSWSPGAGGAPSHYTVYAGTAPGASNLAVAPMGAATSLSAMAPVGTRIYVRVVATNAVGSATSNEVNFIVAAPQAPGAPTMAPAVVNGNSVALSWNPPSGGGAPTGYVVIARPPGSAAVLATLPVGGTSITVPGVPPGTYVVTVVATNGAGQSAESNPRTVTVP